MPKEIDTNARTGKGIYGKGCFLGECKNMTLNPPNELFERELDDLMKKLDKEKFDAQFHCDYHGKCKRKAYVEVYPGNGTWSYLCRWHFILARIFRHKWNYGYWIIKEGEEHEQK